ncbi:fimbrial biogenesis outer membrane usher protein [Bordetella sp. BOR01]|nr:fimbrial biogenesis outer membrane usher protein [Bordetella sp. BOR01]
MLFLVPGGASLAQEPAGPAAVFDESFLHRPNGQSAADLSVFAYSSRVLPGVNSVLLKLNGRDIGMREIKFVAMPGSDEAQPCYSVAGLRELDVKIEAFPQLQKMDDSECGALAAIPSARASYDQDSNVLAVSIPQAALDRKARGAVPVEQWDSGTTAIWSSYRLSYNQMRLAGGPERRSSHTTYLNFRNGLNLGVWRLRGNGSYYENGRNTGWDWSDLYAERDIVAWRGRLRLGDSATQGNIFNSVRFRGIQLRSDDGMLPDSQRGYAPVIRGVAPGSARVTVRQNGNVLYTTFVPAGPFLIDDLYSTPGGGDLEIEVEELGGRTTRFFQPFSALPTMMREGIWNYNFMVGEHRHDYDAERPLMGQLTLAYGLPYGLTAYGGWTTAQQGYNAGALGLAANLHELGAVSTDITTSRSRDARGNTQVGSAASIQYAKSFPGSGTDFTLASYRYNSTGYRSLNDAVRDRAEKQGYLGYSREHEYQLSVLQRLGTMGSLSFNYYGISYRNAPRNARYAQLGYSSSLGRVGYSLNYAVSRSPWDSRESTVMLTLSIPLGGSHTASYTMNRTNSKSTNHSANLSGAMLDDYSLTYALQAGVTRGADRDNGSEGYASLGYASPVGLATASHAYARNSSNTYLDISGAILADSKGMLLGQSLGETAIIVDAPGAAGVAIDALPGVRTNASGRALVPYASPYRENRVSLDAGDGLDGANLKQNVQTVVPTRGAIVVAKFDTEIGRTVLAVLKEPSGMVLPFGAQVYGDDGQQRGIVGPVGRAWLTGLQGASQFTVKWGGPGNQQCRFEIDVSAWQGATEQAKELICAE